jgi:uncharacterized protein YjdB
MRRAITRCAVICGWCGVVALMGCHTVGLVPRSDRGLSATSRLDVSPLRPEVLVGQTVQLQATVASTFAKATLPFQWDSADESIATVTGADENATVTGVSPGKVIISVVSANRLVGSVTVTVR